MRRVFVMVKAHEDELHGIGLTSHDLYVLFLPLFGLLAIPLNLNTPWNKSPCGFVSTTMGPKKVEAQAMKLTWRKRDDSDESFTISLWFCSVVGDRRGLWWREGGRAGSRGYRRVAPGPVDWCCLIG